MCMTHVEENVLKAFLTHYSLTEILEVMAEHFSREAKLCKVADVEPEIALENEETAKLYSQDAKVLRKAKAKILYR